MSLKIMGLNLDPLVRTIIALFICVLIILLVVLVFWGLEFFTNRSRVQIWYFCIWRVHTNMSRVQRWSTHQNVLVLKLLIFFPNTKLNFIVIVVVRICLTHSNCCSFTKNMIRRASMGTIHMPLDYGSRSTESTAFTQWINGWEPQIHEL